LQGILSKPLNIILLYNTYIFVMRLVPIYCILLSTWSNNFSNIIEACHPCTSMYNVYCIGIWIPKSFSIMYFLFTIFIFVCTYSMYYQKTVLNLHPQKKSQVWKYYLHRKFDRHEFRPRPTSKVDGQSDVQIRVLVAKEFSVFFTIVMKPRLLCTSRPIVASHGVSTNQQVSSAIVTRKG